MSLEEMRQLNLQRNAELFSSLGIEKSQDYLWTLKKKATPKRLSEPQRPLSRVPSRRSLRLQNMPVLSEIIPENIPPEEDLRKPAGTFDVATSLRDAGTDVSRESELKKMFSSRMKVFDDSAASTKSLSDFVSNLKSLKMTPMTVAKVTYRRTNSMVMHPMMDKALVVMSDVVGNLGFWDVLNPHQPAIVTQPHSSCITAVGVHEKNPKWVITTSYDGTVRATDMSSMQVLEPFRSPDAIPVLSFDFATPDVVIKGQSNSRASLLDLREPKFQKNKSFQCSDRRASVKSISVHPVESKMFGAATNDGSVLLWDQRHPSKCLEKLEHIRTVQWCRFSPCTGSRLLTSSSSNEIRIYDTNTLKENCIRTERIISHDNNTGRFVAPFRPIWVPQREDCFLIGSMTFPRKIELYNVETGTLAASIQHELLSSINSQVVFHPTQNCLVGGNSSGRAHAFIP